MDEDKQKEQTDCEQSQSRQTSGFEKVQALKEDKRRRIIRAVSVTLLIIGVAVLIGVVSGKIILNIII